MIDSLRIFDETAMEEDNTPFALRLIPCCEDGIKLVIVNQAGKTVSCGCILSFHLSDGKLIAERHKGVAPSIGFDLNPDGRILFADKKE